MLPLQVGDGSPPLPAGRSAGGHEPREGNENRLQKPKTLPCQYCNKRFRRVEHVQRHERTHTKEKPFQCEWDRCGKNFGRRDLLVRHEKLVHLNENSKDGARPRKLSGASNTHHQASLSGGRGSGSSISLQRQVAQQPQVTISPSSHATHPQLSSAQHAQPRRRTHQQQQQLPPPLPSYHQGYLAPISDISIQPDPRGSIRQPACNLDLLSDAALASEVNSMHPMTGNEPTQFHQSRQGYGDGIGQYQDRRQEDQKPGVASALSFQTSRPTYDDYAFFLDDFSSAPHFLPPHFDPEQQMGGLWSRSPGNMGRGGNNKPNSAFPSRLGSLAPDRDGNEDGTRVSLLRISVTDHNVIKNRLDEFSSVLPKDFVFPSRHTLTRFLEGYISGFHEYLPFLHLPTLSPVDIAPELLLAILAVGAQYRFESNRGYALWYAAKAVALEQIRRRHSSEVHALLPTVSAYSPHSTRPSPTTTYRHSFASAQAERPIVQDTHREPFSPNTPQARLETIQAVLLLFAVGLWGVKTILHEALSLQSNLAILIREEGLNVDLSPVASTDWEAWIRLEGSTRTKLIAFCFFNLCSIAYNMPPLLLTSELNLYLPLRSRLWRAESAWQWQELRQSTPVAEITVHEAFSRLFERTSQGLPPQLSSLGSYILIHALLQHVFLLKQTSFSASVPYTMQRTLKHEDVEEVTQSLRVWQNGFEHRRQLRVAEYGHFGGAYSVLGGSLAYNASALLRLAYIRLYTDISPSRSLESRDSMLVASALRNTPRLHRSLRLHRAVFQAVHALSVLVKAGVNYVARTKSSEWSIQNSLCNFECAILLANWLLTLSSIGPNDPPVSPEERNLLEMVRTMLDETEFAVPIDPSLLGPGSTSGQMEMAMSDSARLQQLASAVVRLWAETFKGTHIFDVVKIMGSSLDGYADLVGKPREKGSLGMLGPDTAMG